MVILYDFDDETYEYEVSINEFMEFGEYYYSQCCDKDKNFFITLLENDYNFEEDDDFMFALRESCYENALEDFKDMKKEYTDPYGYRGISESDFH